MLGIFLLINFVLGFWFSREPDVFWVNRAADPQSAVVGFSTTDTLIRVGETLLDFPLCEHTAGAGLPVFPLGDVGARCTRRNGYADTEDLDGDSRLAENVGRVTEDVLRFVFPLGDDRFFVRSGVALTDAQGRPLV